MKKLIFLVFLAAVVAASGQVSAQEGSVGEIVPPPSEVEEIQVQTPPPVPGPQITSPHPSVTPRKTSKKLPYYKTRDGVEEAARRVFGGKFASKKHTHSQYALKGHTHTPIAPKTAIPTLKSTAKEPKTAPAVNNYYFRTHPDDEKKPAKKPPATPEERKNKMWTVLIITTAFLGLVFIAAVVGVIAIFTTNNKNIEIEKTKQTQANQLATALANQAPFTPGAGRSVDISTTIGGNVIRAKSDDKPVVVPQNAWVLTPGPITPAPAGQQPAAHQGQPFDPNAAAQAGANA